MTMNIVCYAKNMTGTRRPNVLKIHAIKDKTPNFVRIGVLRLNSKQLIIQESLRDGSTVQKIL